MKFLVALGQLWNAPEIRFAVLLNSWEIFPLAVPSISQKFFRSFSDIFSLGSTKVLSPGMLFLRYYFWQLCSLQPAFYSSSVMHQQNSSTVLQTWLPLSTFNSLKKISVECMYWLVFWFITLFPSSNNLSFHSNSFCGKHNCLHTMSTLKVGKCANDHGVSKWKCQTRWELNISPYTSCFPNGVHSVFRRKLDGLNLSKTVIKVSIPAPTEKISRKKNWMKTFENRLKRYFKFSTKRKNRNWL